MSPEPPIPAIAHALTAEQTLAALGVAFADGLSPREVRARRRRYGPNRLHESPPRSAWRILLGQLQSLVLLLLGGATLVSLAFAHWSEAAAIGAVIAINTLIGFVTELRAVRSMETLRRMTRHHVRLRRHGRELQLPARHLVPGDIVLLEGGDVVGADLRLVESAKLQCDESALTGESLPVAKDAAALPEATALPERADMAFQGTAVIAGTAAGVVVATGMATALGEIAALAEAQPEGETPLEKRLNRLSGQLVWLTLGLTVLIAVSGIATGRPPLLMLQSAIALAVAAVPEGLPMVATLALARGMWRMARRNALIERLAAVETLGATTTILTDKTGTLTENRMTATRLALPAAEAEADWTGAAPAALGPEQAATCDDPAVHRLLEVAVLCNNATLADTRAGAPEAPAGIGDPMELALLRLAAGAGVERATLLQRLPEVREEAFDPESKMMATYHRADDGFLVAVKGAPEQVLAQVRDVAAADGFRPLSAGEAAHWLARAAALADQGLRVLALARRTVASPQTPPYRDLTLLGLVGFEDPPRADVAPAIQSCREAGIRVVMVTGDHAATARRIATAVGLQAEATDAVIEGSEIPPADEATGEDVDRLLRASVFARVTPRQKLELIRLHQRAGAVVAMTGDGVNDAPALKHADIGVAMGRRGSQVAREAADMILQDDAFTSIVAAIGQGRVIFGNIRKFIVYLMSCNLSELMTVGLATLSGLPLPILPLQILYLNLVTDVFPAFALGAGEGARDLMRQPPRHPAEALLRHGEWLFVIAFGVLITAATLLAFLLARYGLGKSYEQAVTMAFLTLAMAQLWHVFDMRARGSGLLDNEITRNRYVWGALLLCGGLIVAAVTLPGLSDLLRLSPPGRDDWLLALAFSALPTLFGQLFLSLPRGRRRRAAQLPGAPQPGPRA